MVCYFISRAKTNFRKEIEKKKEKEKPTWEAAQLVAPPAQPGPRPTPALSSTPGRGTHSCVPAMPGPPTTGRPRNSSPGLIHALGDAQEHASSIPPLAASS